MSTNEQLIEYMIKRIEDIDSKVDELLKFKWQVIGGSVLFSLIFTGTFQVAIALISK